MLRPNRVRTSYAYDAAGQMVDIVHDKAGEVLASFKYAYDGAGNRVSKEMADGVKETYAYDGDGRLTSAAYGTAREVGYTLDALGNRTVMEETIGATLKSTRYTYNAFNQLLALNIPVTGCGAGCQGAINTAFAYDGNGNLLSETTTVVGQTGSSTKQYAWDLDNRLRQVQMPDGAVHAYAYDANGLRIEQVTPTEATRYVLDGPSVVEELDAANATRTSYIPNPQVIDEILSFEQAEKTYYPLTDALGSIYAIADASGAVVRTSSYDVYGERTTSGTGPSIAFGFTGREHDLTSLNYHRDRYAAPIVGRWNQPDRLGFVDGPNVHQYARGNPVQFGDPFGDHVITVHDKLRHAMVFLLGAMGAFSGSLAIAKYFGGTIAEQVSFATWTSFLVAEIAGLWYEFRNPRAWGALDLVANNIGIFAALFVLRWIAIRAPNLAAPYWAAASLIGLAAADAAFEEFYPTISDLNLDGCSEDFPGN